MLFASEPPRIMVSGQACSHERTAGAWRGTDPTHPADRRNAVMAEAGRIRDAAARVAFSGS